MDQISPPPPITDPTASPEVSILLPVYNAMPWLPLSVLSCLTQESVRIELIAVDDGCTDGSAEWLLACEAALAAAAGGATLDAHTKRRRALDADAPDADAEARRQVRQRLNPALQQQARRLTETNAAALYIHGSAAGDHAAVAAAAEAAGRGGFSARGGFAKELSGEAGGDGAPRALTPEEVVARVNARGVSMLVLHSGGRGQGAALNIALSAARADLVSEIEADDETPSTRIRRLVLALKEHPEWDGVTSQVELIGSERPGMRRYIEWQNSLLTPLENARARFIELPALRQTGLFRRAALRSLQLPDKGTTLRGSHRCDERRAARRLSANSGDGGGGGPRDVSGHVRGGGASGGLAGGDGDRASGDTNACHLTITPTKLSSYRDLIEWPIDIDFWLRWFEHGLVCGKVAAPALYHWRQHAGQHTRIQGRCSLESLRACKAHFLCRFGGPAFRADEIQIWATGKTLSEWARAVGEAAPCARVGYGVFWGGGSGQQEVVAVEYKPGAPPPQSWTRRDGRTKRLVRLFAFGMAKARQKVRAAIRDWDDELDWFVA